MSEEELKKFDPLVELYKTLGAFPPSEGLDEIQDGFDSLAARLKEAEDTILELYDPGYGRDCPGVRYFQKHNPDRNK